MGAESLAREFAVQADSRDQADLFCTHRAGWRAVCIRTGDFALWYFIGSHGDYDRLIATL